MRNPKDPYFKYKLLLLLLFTVSIFSSYFVINSKFTAERISSLENSTTTYSNVYKIIYQRYQEIADIYFTGILDRVDLNKKLYDALNSKDNPKKQDEIRKQIYQSTLPRFDRIKNKNILSVNLFFPDNSIFLIIKKPKNFEQILSSNRHLPKYINQNKKKYDTFEIGKTGAAFRFAYPLFYAGNYAGHIEFAFDITAITSSIMKNYSVRSNMFFNEKYFAPSFLEKTQLFKKPFIKAILLI